MKNKVTLMTLTFLIALCSAWIFFKRIYPMLPNTSPQGNIMVTRPPDALVMPLAGVYKVINDKIVKVGELKDSYFPCVVLKHIELAEHSFVLIMIQQNRLTSDVLMVKESSVIVLNDPKSSRMIEEQ